MSRPPITDDRPYPCGHPRTLENTHTRQIKTWLSKTCRTCENARNRERRQQEAVKAARRAYHREYQRRRAAAKRGERVLAAAERRRPYIVPADPAYLAQMDEAKATYLRLMADRPRAGRPRKDRAA